MKTCMAAVRNNGGRVRVSGICCTSACAWHDAHATCCIRRNICLATPWPSAALGRNIVGGASLQRTLTGRHLDEPLRANHHHLLISILGGYLRMKRPREIRALQNTARASRWVAYFMAAIKRKHSAFMAWRALARRGGSRHERGSRRNGRHSRCMTHCGSARGYLLPRYYNTLSTSTRHSASAYLSSPAHIARRDVAKQPATT